ncbi:phosphoribosylanthranilate isomerase [Desulfosoma caldarium]|uniref:N-(5'-phosphoribosyl)anthranilate isomerase n=1 Tax=Desulfosoma caldarium TaxID=610254 RepID=A0A3N1UER6_9BACT|nr:phosphoribosylanthranilate isomerase [Desulfosoma caldarium]ROQ89865.1 phosphoribosylanthranilate isomerase [Desulfosoma caldarium]
MKPLTFREPIIQVAGILDLQECQTLVDLGVSWLGFPLRLTVHRQDVTEEEAAQIIASVPRYVTPVLITYEHRWREIHDLCRFLSVRAVQLHGPVAPEEVRRLKEVWPTLWVIKSVLVKPGVRAQECFQAVEPLLPFVDALITDTEDPDTGACGATGKTHDWSVSRWIVERCYRPVILAGGLTAENVADAIRTVRPAGVDAHTGLEDASGRKDPKKVAAFLREARAALANL